MGRALQAPSGCNGHVRCRRKARTACSTSGNLRPKPHGQRSFLPSFSDSSLPPYTTRKPALDVSLGWEPLAAFAAGLVEKSRCSGQFLLPDGFSRHITEGAASLILAQERERSPCKLKALGNVGGEVARRAAIHVWW